MSDETDFSGEPTAEELSAVSALLKDPAAWAEPSSDIEDRVVAAITAEAAGGQTGGDPAAPERLDPPVSAGDGQSEGFALGSHGPASASPFGSAAPTGPIDFGRRRAQRRRRLIIPLAAVAAIVAAAVATLTVLNLPDADSGAVQNVALLPTDYAPDASAMAMVEERPNGVRILLEPVDLPPAPEGTFYAFWVIRPEPRSRVGAGTFHLRGGDGEIELWSGVSSAIYSTVSVTLQNEDDPAGPGDVVLRGEIAP